MVGRSGRVLLVGWSEPAALALARADADVVCVAARNDANTAARNGFTGLVLAAEDITRSEAVLAALTRAGRTPEEFDTALTDDEFAVVTAAVVNDLGGGRGLSVGTAVALRDKPTQKRRVAALGVAVAAGVVATSAEDVLDETSLTFPMVVKPVDGGGAMQTQILDDADALRDFFATQGHGVSWLAESFVPGRELHVDGVVRNGQVRLCCVSRYLHNVITVHDGALVASVTLDPTDPLVKAVRCLTEAALRAIGHHDGVFHLELFDDDGRLTFGECAGRIGGGMIAELVERRHGVSLYDEWARAAMHLPQAMTTPGTAAGVFGWANLSAPAGRLVDLPAAGELQHRPGVIEAQVWASPGDTVGDPRTGSHVLIAKVLVRAGTVRAAERCLRDAAAWFATTVTVAISDPHERLVGQ